MAVDGGEIERPPPQRGLVLASTESIRAFLHSASCDSHPSPELQQIASDLSSQASLLYKSLRDIYLSSPPLSRPRLLHLLSGTDFVLSSPQRREKSEELKERLKKLSDLIERNTYEELVKDIKPHRMEEEDYFSSYREQIGFGLHVVLLMFTGFLVGYAAFRALFNHNPVMGTAGGILGLVFCMLLETVLFIVRTSKSSISSSNSTFQHKKYQ